MEGSVLMDIFSRIVDAVDVETFILCKNEAEGKRLVKALMEEMGLKEGKIIFLKKRGPGVRVRVRAYIHEPGDDYGWLKKGEFDA